MMHGMATQALHHGAHSVTCHTLTQVIIASTDTGHVTWGIH